MNCLVCDTLSAELGQALVLAKYEAQYFRCPSCGLIFIPDHPWLPEAYSNPEAIKGDDWREARNIVNARIVKEFLEEQDLPKPGRYLDFGCGDGQFIRNMRAFGYNFYGFDKYYAVDGDITGRYDTVTCFEVLEHLEDPLGEFGRLASVSDIILATTDTASFEFPPKPPGWHYYAVEWGQHITLFTEKALGVLATKNNMIVKIVGARHTFSRRVVV